MFNNSMMEDLFGSYEDENGTLYQGVYEKELQDITGILDYAKTKFTKQELSVIAKYLFYDTFGDSVNLNGTTCKKIAEQINKSKQI